MGSNGLAHPPDTNLAIETIHSVRMAAQEDNKTTTIIIIHHKDNTLHIPYKDVSQSSSLC